MYDKEKAQEAGRPLVPPFVEALRHIRKRFTALEKEKFRKYLDTATSSGNTPLMIATKNALLEVVQILHSWGANIYLKNKMEHSALHIAAYNAPERTFQIMEFLQSHRMDILDKNSRKDTILDITENMAYDESLGTVKRWTELAKAQAQKN